MWFATPETAFANTAFRQKAVDMGIPFQIPAKSVQDKDKTGRKKLWFIVFVEHVEDDTSNSGKKTAKKRVVFQKIGAEFFCNGKN